MRGGEHLAQQQDLFRFRIIIRNTVPFFIEVTPPCIPHWREPAPPCGRTVCGGEVQRGRLRDVRKIQPPRYRERAGERLRDLRSPAARRRGSTRTVRANSCSARPISRCSGSNQRSTGVGVAVDLNRQAIPSSLRHLIVALTARNIRRRNGNIHFVDRSKRRPRLASRAPGGRGDEQPDRMVLMTMRKSDALSRINSPNVFRYA